MTTTPLLDQIRVGTPCTEDWASMRGDERRRRCHACKLDVYDLSAMTRDEGEALLRSATGRTCVRFARRPDGTIVTGDCLTVAAGLRRRTRLVAAAVAGFLGLGGAALAGSAASTGGLSAWQTWKKVPFSFVAAALPAGWVPQEPGPTMGAICPSVPPSVGPTAGDADASPDRDATDSE